MTQRVLDKLAGHDGDFHAIREHLTAIERHLAGVRRDAVLDAETTVNVQAQVDRLGDRIGRIIDDPVTPAQMRLRAPRISIDPPKAPALNQSFIAVRYPD